jgi:hypothetical protein
MRNLPLPSVLSFSILLLGSVVTASDEPPSAPSTQPAGKSSDTKKSGDNGLGDLISGLAGQSLKSFLDPDLLKQVPGKNPAEKAANVRILMGMIEGKSQEEKGAVVLALQKLQSDPALPKPTEEITKRLKDWYPILEGFAGADGYVNLADVAPIVESAFDGTPRRVVLKNLPRLAERMEARRSGLIVSGTETLLRGVSQAKFQKVLENLGVPGETKDADAGPAKREIWAKVLDQVTQDGVVSIPKSIDFVQGLSTSPPPPLLKDKVTFPKGLPVKKLEPFLLNGEIPKDLRISLDPETGRLVVR